MLPTELGLQMLFCLRFAGLGAALGAFYDLLRAIRTHFRLKRWGTGLLDVLFSILGTACFLLLLLRGTDGRLRFYLPLGLIVGFFLYRETVSSGVLHIILWLLKLAGNIADDLWAFVLWAFSFPRGN